MKLTNIFNALLKSFKRDDLTDRAINTRERIIKDTLPVLSIAKNDFVGTSLPELNEYKKSLMAVNRHCPFLPHSAKNDLLLAFTEINKRNYETIDKVIGLIAKYFTDIVDRDSLTYPRLQILTLLENIEFVSEYSVSYTRYLTALVMEKQGGIPLKESLTPAQLKNIEENYVRFFSTLTALGRTDAKNIENQLKAIPTVSVSEDGKEKQMFGKDKLDPTGLAEGFIHVKMSPGYWLGMAWVNYEHARYRRKKEEIEHLKIMLDYVKSQKQGNEGDAAIEIQLTKVKERLDKLDYEVAKYLEKANATIYR